MLTLSNSPTVMLTVLPGASEASATFVAVETTRLLCYEQHTGFTRLRLNDGSCLEVQEGTDEIDRRIRQAASRAISNRQPAA